MWSKTLPQKENNKAYVKRRPSKKRKIGTNILKMIYVYQKIMQAVLNHQYHLFQFFQNLLPLLKKYQ